MYVKIILQLNLRSEYYFFHNMINFGGIPYDQGWHKKLNPGLKTEKNYDGSGPHTIFVKGLG